MLSKNELGFMTPSAQTIELQRADNEKRLPFWPVWMRTGWGAWLARHWKPAAHLWRAEVELAQHRESEAREAAAAAEAMIALHIWAEADFAQPMSSAVRNELMQAWCNWRNYHERKCERAGCEPIGSPSWLARDRGAPPA